MIEPLFSSPTCFGAASIIGPDKIFLVLISLTIAFTSLAYLRRTQTTKGKIALVYTHLIFLFFPFFLLSINTTCGVFCLSCHNNVPALALYAVPTSVLAAVATGFIFLPSYFIYTNKRRALKGGHLVRFAAKHSSRLRIRPPNMYVVDKAKPVAFSFRSFRSAIFISVGLLEILNKKEKEAVILHELAHIRARSSAMKVSKSILNVFSPMSLIVKFYDTGKEEEMADDFAIRVQKTSKHINNAKKKMEKFYS